MSYSRTVFIFSLTYLGINAVPPEACFATFRSDDCGSPPVKVLYYWKPGSRCEVGVWRGCLPNMNMFKDEYECVATCIFVARASPEDYHELNAIERNDTETSIEESTPMSDATESSDLATNIGPDANATDGDGTTLGPEDGNKSGNNTDTSGGNSTSAPDTTNTGGS
ncbi:uncharacterized protein LOC124531408 [Vanessa cardui]|uniref:uncharacterized protein LOC124531408 n=1 Tax=Vanessa cardui TaxID=171605 RepID=UPI001F14179B|nr:uncharacterized protein LOC124531408 [Vanessa cardui]